MTTFAKPRRQAVPSLRSAPGGHHTCGVRTDGSLECWGLDDDGQASPPDGAFASVSAGESHSCGVRTDGSIACWGSDSLRESPVVAATPQAVPVAEQPAMSSVELASVSAGTFYSCGLRSERSMVCWGDQLVSERGAHMPPGNGTARGPLHLHQRGGNPHLRSADQRLGGLLGP